MKTVVTKLNGKVSYLLAFCALCMMMVTSAFADSVTPNVTAPDASKFTELMNQIGSVFTVNVILAIIGAIVAFSAVYALVWWGARRAVRGAMAGIKKGKIRV